MRHIFAAFLVILLFAVPWLMFHGEQAQGLLSFIQNAEDQVASVILAHHPKTIADIKADYNSADSAPANDQAARKVRILLVPGHEPHSGGAEFGDLKERNMTVELANDLNQFLSNNSRYQVFVSRDYNSWNLTFTDYFKNSWNDIIAWEQAHKDEISNLIRVGEFQRVVPDVMHNTSPVDGAMRLYGVSKWANENNIDIVIHIHFNDYPGHKHLVPGKYSGFTIYVPQKEYNNGSTTRALADTIFKRLGKYNAVSDLPGESSGIVEDQDLIAIGAYNSADAASMLIEYGYIYEPQFTNPSLRSASIKDLAFQTFLGLQDFFDAHNDLNIAGSFDTLIMPHSWNSPISANSAANSSSASAVSSASASVSSDIYALQTALLLDGEYPPSSKNMNDCPRTGTLGPCTKEALDIFQKKYRIADEKGFVGQKTVNELNKLYSSRRI